MTLNELTESGKLFKLLGLARYLRGPNGCPWDKAQTAKSFLEYVREEIVELSDALDRNDNENAQEELGDIIFTVLMVAVCAEQEGRINFSQALEDVHTKMVRRHGHVFGEDKLSTLEEIEEAWQLTKQLEKEGK